MVFSLMENKWIHGKAYLSQEIQEKQFSCSDTPYLLEMINTIVCSWMFSITVLIIFLFHYQQCSLTSKLVLNVVNPHFDTISFSTVRKIWSIKYGNVEQSK